MATRQHSYGTRIDFLRHKNYIPKIMYFAASSMPQKENCFDSRLHFEPLLEEVKARRISTNRKSGTAILQPISIDRANFNEVMIKFLEKDST